MQAHPASTEAVSQNAAPHIAGTRAQDAAAPLPSSVDVAIIGGGVIGVSTAYALARTGIRVALFEKASLACEQSSRNWGWVRTLTRDLPEVPLAMRSNQLWAEIQAQVDVGFRRTGMLYLQETESDAASHQTWIDNARTYGIDARQLDRRATLAHLPDSRRDWTGAMYSPTDGVAEPQFAVQGIASLARQEGAGSRLLFEHLLREQHLDPTALHFIGPPVRSETDLALAVRDGKADAGFGIAAVARQCRVDFVPLHRERYDLVIRRWEYFEPPFQRLLAFTRTTRFVEKAAEFGGYDITGIGHVTYNSP